MFKGKLDKDFAIDFAALLSTVGNQMVEVVFRVAPTGMRIHATSEGGVMALIADYKLEDVFAEIDTKLIKNEDVFKMNSDFLKKILRKLKGEHLDVEYNNADLVFKNENSKFNIPVLEVNDNERNFKLPPLMYNTEFSINTTSIMSVIESCNIIGKEKIKIQVKDGKVSMYTSSASRESNFNYVFKDSEIIKEEGKFADASGDYNIKFISSAMLGLDFVEVNINNNYPMKLQYKYGGDSNIRFFIAPIVAND